MLKKLLTLLMICTMILGALTSCGPKEKGTDILYRYDKDTQGYTLTRAVSVVGHVYINTFKERPVTIIGEGAFENDKGGLFDSVELGENVIEIGERAFKGCSKLNSVKLGIHVQVIGKSAFEDCDALITARISDGVLTIQNNAYAFCDKLRNVYLGKNIKVIQENAFENCISLEHITIPIGIQSIANNAFLGCENIGRVFYEGTPEQWESVAVGEGNSTLLRRLYFYSATAPTDTEHRYWHYDKNGSKVLW